MNSKEEFYQIESSQRQYNEIMYHQERMNIIVEQEEYNLFNLLKPKLFIDGAQWCVLYGEDMQSGICGFGESPYKAILEFNKAWNKPLNKLKGS